MFRVPDRQDVLKYIRCLRSSCMAGFQPDRLRTGKRPSAGVGRTFLSGVFLILVLNSALVLIVILPRIRARLQTCRQGLIDGRWPQPLWVCLAADPEEPPCPDTSPNQRRNQNQSPKRRTRMSDPHRACPGRVLEFLLHLLS